MNRFLYDRNGRPFNLEVAETIDDFVDPDGPVEDAQGMEIRGDLPRGEADKLDKLYMTLAMSVMSLIRRDTLRSRTLASGLIVYEADRNVRLEAGIQQAMMPHDTIAHNFEDFFAPPLDVQEMGFDHTRWIAQQLIDFDYGLQHQRQARENL